MDQGFDWVTARAKCNVAELFGKLREVVEGDVKAANANEIAATFEGHANHMFTVRTPGSPGKGKNSRTFSIGESEITVRGPGQFNNNTLFTASADLYGTDCMVEVKDHGRLKLWEFSRIALEPMFFNGR